MFYFHPENWGKFSFWRRIFSRGWNHQLDTDGVSSKIFVVYFCPIVLFWEKDSIRRVDEHIFSNGRLNHQLDLVVKKIITIHLALVILLLKKQKEKGLLGVCGWLDEKHKRFWCFSRKNRTEAIFIVLFLFAAQKKEITYIEINEKTESYPVCFMSCMIHKHST